MCECVATLNYGDPPPSSDTTALLTETLLGWECRVQTPRCLAWARRMLQRAAADNPGTMCECVATLNYGDPPPSSDTTALLTETLLAWECRVQTPRCLAWARQLFQRAGAADNV
ncbi:unnamed protein product [Plutella xylostella]|uniref:(diamondback moth) hypothetical protein n=1 Tax=Plutella xylostella TaxID=51655 RepID=A0A8S4GB41_PLUXY|nr:unnamed protein product [Plutella xylostella]